MAWSSDCIRGAAAGFPRGVRPAPGRVATVYCIAREQLQQRHGSEDKGDIVMRLLLRVIGIGSVLLACMGWLPAVAAQQPQTGAICVTTFADANENGIQDAGESALAGVNVNLSTGGAIIATHITTDSTEGYCFENLLRGQYAVMFTDAPTYRFTTPREGAFALDAGERLTIDPVGAVPVPVDTVRATLTARSANQTTGEPLDSSTRLLLATVGSVMVMLFMIGLGIVVLGLMGRRRNNPPPPPDIAPPPPPFTPPR